MGIEFDRRRLEGRFRNIFAFAVSSMLFGVSVAITTALDTKVLYFAKPPSIDPDYQSKQ
ncbi:MAG: hypothetical protein WBF33_18685 [Candidatus Nitrosopolaris sp.]